MASTKSPITCHGTVLLLPSVCMVYGEPDRLLRGDELPPFPVLDSSLGKPAPGVKVQLLAPTVGQEGDPGPAHGGVWIGIGTSATNADGRCLDLLPTPNPATTTTTIRSPGDSTEPPPYTLQPGTYQIVFETKEYFEKTGRKSFYPFVQVGLSAS